MDQPTPVFQKFYVTLALLFIAFILSPSLKAQTGTEDALTYNSVDSTSYSLYLNNDWKALSRYCDEAIKQGYDYYYLRLRAGIAYFELNQFRTAIVHFDAAITFNSLDDVAPGYLYACYVYTERLEEAKRITKSIGPVLSESMRLKDLSPIDFITVENGFKHSPDSNRLYKNPLFSSIGFQHSVSRRFSLSHTLSYYTQEEARFKVQQFQYYLKGAVPLKHNVMLYVGGHYINDQSEARKFTTVENNANTSYTVPVFNGPGQPPLTQTVQSSYTYTSIVTTTVTTPRNAYVFAATLVKQTALLNYSLGFTGSKLDTATQYQVSAGLCLFPLKNNRLGIGATVYQHSEDDFKTNKVAVAPYITAYPTKNFFLSLSYFTNTGNNIIENTGYLVNNSIDYTSSRFAVSASHKLFNNAWLYASYGHETKKHLTQEFKYTYNMLLIGIKIIPSTI